MLMARAENYRHAHIQFQIIESNPNEYIPLEPSCINVYRSEVVTRGVFSTPATHLMAHHLSISISPPLFSLSLSLPTYLLTCTYLYLPVPTYLPPLWPLGFPTPPLPVLRRCRCPSATPLWRRPTAARSPAPRRRPPRLPLVYQRAEQTASLLRARARGATVHGEQLRLKVNRAPAGHRVVVQSYPRDIGAGAARVQRRGAGGVHRDQRRAIECGR